MKKGLEGVVALDTSISFIDGLQGTLKYRGIDVRHLAEMSYDSVSYLLINGRLPDEQELTDYSRRLKNERIVNHDMSDLLKIGDFGIESLDLLRTAVSCSAHFDHEKDIHSTEANMNKAIRLIARLPTMVAALERKRIGIEPIDPNNDLSHGANFLYMLNGRIPTEIEAEAIEKDLILSAEHELNPSTFSLRIAASTLSDLYSAIVCGLCTLKGPLHGGARKGVMDMLDEVTSPENAEGYINDRISGKEKIMGFGHRVYKTYDPRSHVYKDIARRISLENGNTIWYDIAEEIERVMHNEFIQLRGKPIYPNVDFYSAVVYKYLEIPSELATSVFAIGRISGWVAHCLEQYSNNRVIRPRANFV